MIRYLIDTGQCYHQVLLQTRCLIHSFFATEITRGAMLSNSCAACHGTDGKSPGAIPSIYGKSSDFISQALTDFREGKRPATVMGRHATGYTDEEIRLSACSKSADRAKVIIIGGGFGGSTCAKYLQRFDSNIDITLIEPSTRYITCPFSNTVIAGMKKRELSSLFNYISKSACCQLSLKRSLYFSPYIL